MMEWIQLIIGGILILCGLVVFGFSIFGVYRFNYVLNRMHAAAMGDTLGIMFVLVGLIIFSGFTFTSLKMILTLLMLWLTSPVSSHLIARLEIHTNEKLKDHMKEVHH